MSSSKKYLLTTILLLLILSACGAEASPKEEVEAIIQTSVAETVTAQAQDLPPTLPPLEPVIPTQTPFQQMTPTLPPITSPTPQGSTKKFECAKASLQDESIVDGTIFRPDSQFTKTWYITNTSTCVWDSNYKIIFWDGNILGGGYYYNLPQNVAPGQTIPISLVLTTPTTDGSYRSEWKLQTPDGINFGVGMYDASFYTDIVVSSAEKPKYAVTNVDLYIVRDPQYGCQPPNMYFTAYATITTNGPLEYVFRWFQQDGHNSSPQTVKMTSAGNKTFTRIWHLARSASQNSNRWFQIVILEPEYKEYPPVKFTFECP